jgi:hypothetical protein
MRQTYFMDVKLTALERIVAFGIAALAMIGLGWQFHINGATVPEWGPRAWLMAFYFTNITNLLVAVHMLSVASGRKTAPDFTTSITLSIIMVGIIYRLLLAPEVPKPAPEWYPDFFVHVAVPILTTIWWIIWAPKGLRIRDLPTWLVLPLAYCAYALIRGSMQGSYPYFFFDIGKFGLGAVSGNCIGLVFVFGVCGVALWIIARLIRR